MALISGLKPEKATSLLEELKAAGATVEDEELKTHKWPAALRRADQSAGHQSDGGQYVHPDLLVGDDGAGPGRNSGRKEEQGLDVISWPRS